MEKERQLLIDNGLPLKLIKKTGDFYRPFLTRD